MVCQTEIIAGHGPIKSGIIEASTSFLKEYFGYMRKMLMMWAQKGCPKPSYGKWDLIAVIQWCGARRSVAFGREQGS